MEDTNLVGEDSGFECVGDDNSKLIFVVSETVTPVVSVTEMVV